MGVSLNVREECLRYLFNHSNVVIVKFFGLASHTLFFAENAARQELVKSPLTPLQAGSFSLCLVRVFRLRMASIADAIRHICSQIKINSYRFNVISICHTINGVEPAS